MGKGEIMSKPKKGDIFQYHFCAECSYLLGINTTKIERFGRVRSVNGNEMEIGWIEFNSGEPLAQWIETETIESHYHDMSKVTEKEMIYDLNKHGKKYKDLSDIIKACRAKEKEVKS